MWTVEYLPAAQQELGKLPGTEQAALNNAVRKLQALGPSLPYPHSSDVRGADDLRELRPRGGRCAWRQLYRRAGDGFIIAAIAPEGGSNPRGFAQACERALQRLAELEEE
jgi:hypothetical protein